MTKMTPLPKYKKMELLDEYYQLLAPLSHTAQQAFGSRATETPEHDVSQKFTSTLTEYYEKGGSLKYMAEALKVTYPALRRRVMTATLEPLPPLAKAKRSTAPTYMYVYAKEMLEQERAKGSKEYHTAIKKCYDSGLSLNKLARFVGLTSPYPLYYGLSKARLAEQSGSGS
jgi:hypothetical protein